MRAVGRGFRRRYERYGNRRHADAVDGVDGDGRNDDRYAFMDHWNVRAYSTNYLRTVMSVQCFLDGLIGGGGGGTIANDDECDDDVGDRRRRRRRKVTYAGGGLRRYYADVGMHERVAHMDMPVWTTTEDMKERSCGSSVGVGPVVGDDDRESLRRVRVQVRDKEFDTLNAFDKHPRMMHHLVRDVIATERFQR
jgi:hypothetical protein